MVKHLSGGQYNGDRVPTCVFWSTLSTTDKETDLATVEGEENQGNCIANAYFTRDEISCFNDGDCNGEGKCLPCTKYRYGGARLAISHSPPLDVLKEVNRGLTDAELQSPNEVAIPRGIANRVDADQLPYHVLLRNIQARIKKCCRWSLGDGKPDEFFVTSILNGPTTAGITDANGNLQNIKGIQVGNPDIFPDEVGTFFPVGTVVVAGWKAQPSFYLEPRTGIPRSGTNVIYTFNTSGTNVATIRGLTGSAGDLLNDAKNQAISLDKAASNELSRVSAFAVNAGLTNSPDLIASAGAKAAEALANKTTTASAKTFIDTTVGEMETLDDTIQSTDSEEATILSSASDYAEKANLVANALGNAANAVAGSAEEFQARFTQRDLLILARDVFYASLASTGLATKCDLVTLEENPARQWNRPDDGSLPCNGVRTECPFYSGPAWEYATDAKMEIGQNVNAEQIQEIRFHSDDWSKFTNPESEWEGRFQVPFIWAFKQYVDVNTTPDIEDFLLYRQKLLFPDADGNGTAEDLSDESYQTIEMDQVKVGDYSDFRITKSSARIQPGSDTPNIEQPPDFPTLVQDSTVPSVLSLSITHPQTDDDFIYRTWHADANKITIFGTATPYTTIYLVNDTALRERNSYLDFYGDRNFNGSLPSGLFGAPNFTGIPASRLLEQFERIETEKRVNSSKAPIGFDVVTTTAEGSWSSVQEIDLVHNTTNRIYAFLLIDDTEKLVDNVTVDYRFMHSIIHQNSFEGEDFTIHDTLGISKLGATIGDVTVKSKIVAEPATIVARRENPRFNYGYYGWRVKNRGLRDNAALTTTADLQAGNIIEDIAAPFVTESDASTFIVNTGYHVVQYRGELTLGSDDWYPIDDCGSLMCIIRDTNVHRVLPLPDTTGAVVPLEGILVNGGVGTGSTVAQWGIENATFVPNGAQDETSGGDPITQEEVYQAALDAGMSEGEALALSLGFPTAADADAETPTGLQFEPKDLVQFYRDPDGYGLPANYVILGPGITAEDKFGRPDPTRDAITITFTFLRAETNKPAVEDPDDPSNNVPENQPELEGYEAVTDNFYGDDLRFFEHTISFDSQGALTAGGERVWEVDDDTGDVTNTSEDSPITQEQQEYVWVFEDSEGRPIGRKYSRLMLMYSSIACINVEIFYSWSATCTMYALVPDLYVSVGDNAGELQGELKATVNVGDLTLDHRIAAGSLGDQTCAHKANCATHEYIAMGPLRREFEVILLTAPNEDPETQEEEPFVRFENGGKAYFPTAGQTIPPTQNGISDIISQPPGSQWLKKHGPMWYPYTACERPRYNETTLGPQKTDSTELINSEEEAAGLNQETAESAAGNSNAGSGASAGNPALLSDDQAEAAAAGSFGSLPPQSDEAYRGPDRMVAKILDIHPSIRVCTSAFTYGNRVLKTASAFTFTGYGRRRGEIDLFWFTGRNWQEPPFGNFGRGKLTFEVTMKRGDYLGGFNGRSPGFRWMPMFPEREDMGANVDLWSEDLEPQVYRLTNIGTPNGGVAEMLEDPPSRYRHKQIITNIPGAAIEYPYAPYFPSFVPDDFLESGEPVDLGANHGNNITTMWAWREQDKSIQRGRNGSNPIPGLKFTAPDYFLDNRRLEVSVRPSESDYEIIFTPPVYDVDGNQTVFGKIQIGEDGPPREISIDYANKEFQVLNNGIYDVSKQLNEGGDDDAIPCEDNTPTDNPKLTSTCQCILDIEDESLDEDRLPSRYVHLDEFAATPGQFGLYVSDEIQTPVAVDIPRESPEDPCCQCLYYRKGILAEISLEDLPITTSMDPVFDSRVNVKYTWSRVPHGFPQSGLTFSSDGVDGAFAAREHLTDSYIDVTNGAVFLKRFGTGVNSTSVEDGEIAVFFPSNRLAQDLREDDSSLRIVPQTALEPGDPRLKGGLPATALPDGNPSNKFSNGQSELVNIDMVFDTPVKITNVKVLFMAGEDDSAFGGRARIKWEVPSMTLGVIDSENRVGPPPYITRRLPRTIAGSAVKAFGRDVPGDFTRDERTIINNGAYLFEVNMTPGYSSVPYWNQFGQEFHLIFDARDNDGSLGIASIEMEVEAMVPSDEQLTETIRVRERKYYRSVGTPGQSNNPESYLTGMDSASAYWRTSNELVTKGSNKFRSYSWDEKLEDNQQPEAGDPSTLEKIQAEEYDKARLLQTGPNYQFEYQSFIPLDEREFLEFVAGGRVPEWTTTLTHTLNDVDKVRSGGNGMLHFGEVPERTNWTAPGHAWTHNFVTSFGFCCDPPGRCPAEMTIDYNFAHLHDGLSVTETARFWDELPSGLTRLIRSTMYLPDPGFITGAGQGNLAAEGVALLDGDALLDSQGRPIDPRIIDQAGIRKDDEGNLIIIDRGE